MMEVEEPDEGVILEKRTRSGLVKGQAVPS